MSKYFFIILFILFTFPKVLAETILTIESSVQEKIADSIYVNIVKTNSTEINVLLNFSTSVTKDTAFNKNLVQYSFSEGISVTKIRGLIGFSYKLVLSKEQLIGILSFLHSEQSKSLDLLTNFNFSIVGKINQQKLLGNFYSQWSDYQLAQPVAETASNLLTISFPEDLYKNTEQFWTWVVAALIRCNHQSLKSVAFELSHESLSCTPLYSNQQVTDGNIANLKSNFYQYLLVKQSDSGDVLELFSGFKMEDNYEELLEFSRFLPKLSIESISQVYHSLDQSDVVQVDKQPADPLVPVKPLINTFNNLKMIGSDSSVLEFGITVKNTMDFCQYINCDQLKKEMNFKLVDTDSQSAFFKFPKVQQEKFIGMINDFVIKPLTSLESKLTQESVSLIIKGAESAAPFNNILASLSILPTTNYQVEQKSGKPQFVLSQSQSFRFCFSADQRATMNWSKNILFSYVLFSEYNNFELWTPNFSNCLFPLPLNNDSSSENVSKVSKVINSIVTKNNIKKFNGIKKAALNRINIIDESSIEHLSLERSYKAPLKGYLIEQLSALTFEEYNYYLKNDLLNNVPQLTLFSRTNEAVELKSIKSYAETSE